MRVPRFRSASRRTNFRTAVRPRLEALEERSVPATLTVTTLADGGTGSLRSVLALANDGDAIQFDPGLNGGQITLTAGELQVRRSVAVQGLGPADLTVSGNNAGRVFEIFAGATVTIAGLTITGGLAVNTATGRYGLSGEGGGVRVDAGATLTLDNSAVLGNVARGSAGAGDGYGVGGGIESEGTLTVTNSTVAANSAIGTDGGFGGGIDGEAGTLTVLNSLIAYNSAAGPSFTAGGGIEGNAAVTVTGSTLAYNTAVTTGPGFIFATGGGIDIGSDESSSLTMTNSTVTGNSATATGSADASAFGGGIADGNPLRLTNCTIVGNSIATSGPAAESQGGGIYTDEADPTSPGRLVNTIVAGNIRAGGVSDIYLIDGTLDLTNSRNNLVGTGGAGGLVNGQNGNRVGVSNPGLGTLGDYGGPTVTIPLLAGSPALNAGTAAGAPATDQRGLPRTGGINIGAYQASAFYFDVSVPDTVTAGGPFDVVVTARDFDGQVAVGYTGTVYLTSSDPQAGYLDQHTFTVADGGAFTFSGEVLYTPGDQVLYAWDSNIGGTSPVVTVM